MSKIQDFLHAMEVGPGRVLIYMVPLIVTLAAVMALLDFRLYRGLNDAQSMDNAQLARQIVRGEGFTTQFLRPYAIDQLADFTKTHPAPGGSTELFPPSKFPPGTPLIVPDTYNAPAYPYLLAGWFKLLQVNFDQTPSQIGTARHYSGDLWIPLLNQILVLLTSLLVAGLGYRLFDARVAWVAPLAFLGSNFVWSYSMTGLSTILLMFLVTAFLFAALEVYEVGTYCFESEEGSFWPAWLWTLAAAVLLALVCLTRLNFLILLPPFLVFLGTVPRTNFFLLPMAALVVIVLVAPWFWRTYQVSGNPLGSNMPLILAGEGDYAGDQIYRQSTIPNYEQSFRNLSRKEYNGLRWNFEHAWDLLGSNPMALLFAAALLHKFKRAKVQAFRWLVIGGGLALVVLNNIANDQPDPIGPWNVVAALLPAMIVIGSAFFLILLDRLNLQVGIINQAIIVGILLLTTFPLALTIYFGKSSYYNYPPYSPPFIKLLCQMTKEDEWVTTDMPWATAWYGDRASLWLPDTIEDFEVFHDDFCPTGLILLTPVTLGAPVMNLTTGEDKDWYSFITGTDPPTAFPLPAHTKTPVGSPEYIIWSDRPRWK